MSDVSKALDSTMVGRISLSWENLVKNLKIVAPHPKKHKISFKH